MTTAIRIATRKSKLALWQAHWTQAQLANLGHDSELVLIETQGDKDYRAFAQLSGQGFFTKAVQDAVIEGRADIAVHSCKDLPSAPLPELEIAAYSARADARDVLLVHPDKLANGYTLGRHTLGREEVEVKGLPLASGAVIGTSAVRRQSQLQNLQADVQVLELRGNVPTRLERLRAGEYDAIMLAAAGLERLELDTQDVAVFVLEPDVLVPAPAQGVLALEIHRDNYQLAQILTDINDMPTYKRVAAERGLMAMLQGGCQLALGAYAERRPEGIHLRAYFEGQQVDVVHPSSEAVACLAFEALGRPQAGVS